MNSDYLSLKHLQTLQSYKILEALWVYQVTKIEEKRDAVAAKGSETAWRYWAGQEKGFKLAMTALSRALVDMELKEENSSEDKNYDMLMEELKLRGDKPQ